MGIVLGPMDVEIDEIFFPNFVPFSVAFSSSHALRITVRRCGSVERRRLGELPGQVAPSVCVKLDMEQADWNGCCP